MPEWEDKSIEENAMSIALDLLCNTVIQKCEQVLLDCHIAQRKGMITEEQLKLASGAIMDVFDTTQKDLQPEEVQKTLDVMNQTIASLFPNSVVAQTISAKVSEKNGHYTPEVTTTDKDVTHTKSDPIETLKKKLLH